MIIYKHGNDFFEPQKSAYTADEITTKLSASETKILQYLIDNNGEIVSRETLLEIGWPEKIVVPNSLNVAIANLRKAFKTKNEIIITIKGAGFTVAKNTFVKQQQRINEEELRQEESETIDLLQVTTSDTRTEINDRQESPHNGVYIQRRKVNWQRACTGVLVLLAVLWVSLWLSSWQTPPCVAFKNQKVCGNIELLKPEQLPKDKEGTLYIDMMGKIHAQN
ncbi:TPA: winged helix-turn-helix domain-containing protein [Photobacterium damselae]|uniref:winged helix-turn-helix domain-containing protein n=1 Tax=Photobacterium damselae TaxID=38293 RepID=UPI001592BA95|nr:helix-turn-helix domain-containing protein [Photobacterium damselae]MCG3822992.1 helix-turn-helix domain-containing protein [Photobacterium damselae]NVH46277.1 helix-turn-helix domain-containing protein [Photobacterium damselae subsp. damselae]